MISAVLDTNVLASGTVTAFNPPGQILNSWRDGEFELVLSQYILDELEQTLQKPYFRKRLSFDQITLFIDLLENEALIIPITTKVHGVATHPEDDLILATAVSAKVDYLVTGDGPLLQKVGDSYRKVNLVIPSEFLRILKQQS